MAGAATSENETVSISGIPDKFSHRYDGIISIFKSKFGKNPEFFGRAPGRVNLIGEHIDYCGYSVHPMAVEQDIVIAVSTQDNAEIVLVNSNPQYREVVCDINNFEIMKSKPEWQNYFLCGVKGILDHLNVKSPRGMCCVVDGTIPQSAGLSSSSALVCCAAVITMHANNHSLSKKELADLCCHCEQYIGTEGGGMDQAISFMAKAGIAKLIEFNPLKTTDVTLPDGATFVIANSCVEMNKAATSHFNIRVVECRMAAQLLAKKNGLVWRDHRRLKDVQISLKKSLKEMIKHIQESLHTEPYTKEEICQILQVSSEELASTSLSPNTLNETNFKLFQRANHVFSEALRVLEFKQTCEEGGDNALGRLGDLMTSSHNSCRDLYECSCPELDTLVNLCLESGALGSRLTGAGWGGCTVSLVPTNNVDSFILKIKNSYYSGSRDGKDKFGLFASQPGPGAALYKY